MNSSNKSTLLQCCFEIKELLAADAKFFKNNHIAELLASDAKKNNLLSTLTDLIKKDVHKSLAPAELAEINRTVKSCQELMAINSKVVHANLYRMKHTLDIVLGRAIPAVNTYDDKGRTK